MRWSRVVPALLVFLVVSPTIGGLLIAGRGSILVVSGAVLIGVLVVGVGIAAGRSRAGRGDDGDGGAWSLVPDWQYGGRFAEAGGLTVGEQSEAIKEVRTDAEEIERNRK